jgi:hypothetical protein
MRTKGEVMDKELQMKLVEKYPTVFKDYGGDMRQTCMAWGICCGNGWYDIIDELCAKLEPMGIVAAQIKEKFGGLRFYVNDIPNDTLWDEIHGDKGCITEAEVKSLETCENCGKPGKIVGEGWIRTLCDECNEKKD